MNTTRRGFFAVLGGMFALPLFGRLRKPEPVWVPTLQRATPMHGGAFIATFDNKTRYLSGEWMRDGEVVHRLGAHFAPGAERFIPKMVDDLQDAMDWTVHRGDRAEIAACLNGSGLRRRLRA